MEDKNQTPRSQVKIPPHQSAQHKATWRAEAPADVQLRSPKVYFVEVNKTKTPSKTINHTLPKAPTPGLWAPVPYEVENDNQGPKFKSRDPEHENALHGATHREEVPLEKQPRSPKDCYMRINKVESSPPSSAGNGCPRQDTTHGIQQRSQGTAAPRGREGQAMTRGHSTPRPSPGSQQARRRAPDSLSLGQPLRSANTEPSQTQ